MPLIYCGPYFKWPRHHLGPEAACLPSVALCAPRLCHSHCGHQGWWLPSPPCYPLEESSRPPDVGLCSTDFSAPPHSSLISWLLVTRWEIALSVTRLVLSKLLPSWVSTLDMLLFWLRFQWPASILKTSTQTMQSDTWFKKTWSHAGVSFFTSCLQKCSISSRRIPHGWGGVDLTFWK